MKKSICFGCGRELGFRGFCTQKCHDDYYDYLLESKKSEKDD
jgi:hypothetical protein